MPMRRSIVIGRFQAPARSDHAEKFVDLSLELTSPEDLQRITRLIYRGRDDQPAFPPARTLHTLDQS